MTCSLEVAEESLKSALAAIEKAKIQGFTHSTAILTIVPVSPESTSIMLVHNGGTILKADQSDPSKNWGYCNESHIEWYKLDENQVLNV